MGYEAKKTEHAELKRGNARRNLSGRKRLVLTARASPLCFQQVPLR